MPVASGSVSPKVPPKERSGARERECYLSLRRKFEPTDVKLVFVAESPPASGRYFYDPDGSVSEPLFRALLQSLHLNPPTKEAGLHEFQNAGWVLVDSTYQAVNGLDNVARDEIIRQDYPRLRDDLMALIPRREAPLILIKANVCRLLEPLLLEDGFNVLNRGRPVYFPSHGRQNQSREQCSALLASLNEA